MLRNDGLCSIGKQDCRVLPHGVKLSLAAVNAAFFTHFQVEVQSIVTTMGEIICKQGWKGETTYLRKYNHKHLASTSVGSTSVHRVQYVMSRQQAHYLVHQNKIRKN